MSESSYNSKRVAKNTLILYVRMIFMMLISLYTSRVILSTLGVEDFGIYDVVGGVVSMFSILSSSLSTAISRYITFGLGKNDIAELRKIYSTAIIIQVSLAILIGILIEIIGVWYLYNKMNIPEGRTTAAFWVLQCSIVTFGLGLISVPYNAEIVAHEKMDTYAYFSILDAALALINVYLLYIFPADKLIVFAVLNMLCSLLMRFLYAIYCRKHFEECRFEFVLEKGLLKEIGGFAGWHLLGESTWILNTQGINLLVNSYFGVTMNAARAVGNKINGAVGKFSGNFMTALSPQITKTYAEGNLEGMNTLLFRGTRLSYYLMLFFALPICIEAPIILSLWLKEVPPLSVMFTRLTIISSMITLLGNTLVKAQQATGKLKRYQITISLCAIWVFPLTWIAYRMGKPVEWSYYIFILNYFIQLFVRIYLLKDLIDFPCWKYIKEVYIRIAIVTLIAATLPIIIYKTQPEGILRLIEVFFVSSIGLAATIFALGIDPNERRALINFFKKKVDTLRS